MMAETNTINREACAWIAKLHDGDPSPQDFAALQEWTNQSPEHRSELRRMAKRWDELNVLTELAVPVEMPGVRESLRDWSLLKRFSRREKISTIAVVASIMVFAFAWAPFNFLDEKAPPSSVIATAIGEQRLVSLADNSTVLLNTNSQLRVNYNDDFRNVYLIQGEAHFDVTRNPERPFRVFAGSGMFRALGTAFSVYLKDDTVEVTVTEGIVAISGVQDAAGIGEPTVISKKVRQVVKAGQIGVYDQFGESIELIAPVNPLEASRKLAWHGGMLRFSGDPLGEVIAEVSRYTPLSIVILDPELRDLRIGGSFAVGETEKMFEALRLGFGVRIERIDDSLVHLSLVTPSPGSP